MTSLRAEHHRLSSLMRRDALEKAGKPAFRKIVIAHRLVTDLLARDGGSSEERAYVFAKLNEPVEASEALVEASKRGNGEWI